MDKLMIKCELIKDKSINGTLFRLYYKQFMVNCLRSKNIIISDLVNTTIEEVEYFIIDNLEYRYLNILEKKAIKRVARILNG